MRRLPLMRPMCAHLRARSDVRTLGRRRRRIWIQSSINTIWVASMRCGMRRLRTNRVLERGFRKFTAAGSFTKTKIIHFSGGQLERMMWCHISREAEYGDTLYPKAGHVLCPNIGHNPAFKDITTSGALPTPLSPLGDVRSTLASPHASQLQLGRLVLGCWRMR
jgi:hypothetical protein